VKRWAVVLSPVAVIGVCRGLQLLLGPSLGAWSWAPTMLVFWALIACLIAWGGEGRLATRWLARPHGRVVWSVLAVIVGLLSVREFLDGRHSLQSPGLVVLWIGYALVNPWFEEGYWRGLLLDATAGWPAGLGIVYSAAAFAISHPLIWGVHSAALRSPKALVGLAIVGLVWAVAYRRTGSLRFTIAGHFCANLLGLAVPVLLNLHVPSALRG
jgi:membrane protease YdiL (CAAX protease family)